jgi:hypothetical protein
MHPGVTTGLLFLSYTRTSRECIDRPQTYGWGRASPFRKGAFYYNNDLLAVSYHDSIREDIDTDVDKQGEA